MRTIIGLVFLALLAVVLAYLVQFGQDGVVSFFVRQSRVDVSLNFFAIILFCSFVFLYFALKLLTTLFGLPERARQWRHLQREQVAFATLQTAITQILSGRFVKARKSLKPLLRHSATRGLAHLLSAEAAQAVQFDSKSEEHIAAMQKALPLMQDKAQAQELQEAMLMRRARWLMKAQKPNEVLQTLEEMPQGVARRTQALRLKLRAAQMLGDTPLALDTARLLARHGGFSEVASHSILRRLMIDNLEQARDSEQLHQIWQALSRQDRAQAEVACHMALRLHALVGEAAAGEARDVLAPVWKRYADLPQNAKSLLCFALAQNMQQLDTLWLANIEKMQNQYPADADLQYLAACASYALGLWGKSEQWLQKAAPVLSAKKSRQHAWQLLAALCEKRGDFQAALAAWKSAAA